MTPSLASPALALTADDHVLLHAVAMAGDSVREADVAYLLERWPWATPMNWERVVELEEAGLLHPTDDGWFVPLGVDLASAAQLPRSLDPVLKGFVGEMLCRHADSFERFQQGFRRLIAGGREHSAVAVCRAWARTPAAEMGPRGERFVAALGAKRLGPVLSARLREAVPEPVSARAWGGALRALASFVILQTGLAR